MEILIIDDDKALAKSLQIQLTTQDHIVKIVHTGAEGIKQLEENLFDLLLLDLTLPDQKGLDILESIDLKNKEIKVVVISGREDMDSTIKAIQLGAFDFLRKPLDIESIFLVLEKVKRELSSPQSITEKSKSFDFKSVELKREIIGNHPLMIDIFKQIGLLSRNKVNVLIQGGSGSGKELIARALHKNECPAEPFIAINCSAIVDNLLESELFGHEKGSFTGAVERKLGKFELAKSGIIFFDEIGEMSLNLQAKILRVLQEREFERIGGNSTQPIYCRAIFATHRNLELMVEEGNFREDLYYRIAVGRIKIPFLEERKSDIPLLIDHILSKLNSQYGIGHKQLSKDAIDLLKESNWPGNVRQLENLLLRVATMSATEFLEKQDFEKELVSNSPISFSKKIHELGSDDLTLTLAQVEKNYITEVLLYKAWNITHTALSLNISPTTLRKKIKDFEIKES